MGQCTSSGSGACVNPSDQSVKSSYDLEQESFDCFLQCNPGSAECFANCISSNTGLSPDCATCYGQGVQCVIDNCTDPCLSSLEGPECVSCRAQYCDGPFTSCSGWAEP
jgi:hypothetical protein